MNKYQKIALAAGAIALILIFGKTITKIGFTAIRSLSAMAGKFLIIIIAIVLIISFLKKAVKKN